MTECSYCRYYGTRTLNPSRLHLTSHPVEAVAVGVSDDMSTPESRVRAYLASFEEWYGIEDDRHIHTTGEYNSPDRVSLHATDLRALLNQLESVTRDRDLTAAENRELLAQSLGYID